MIINIFTFFPDFSSFSLTLNILLTVYSVCMSVFSHQRNHLARWFSGLDSSLDSSSNFIFMLATACWTEYGHFYRHFEPCVKQTAFWSNWQTLIFAFWTIIFMIRLSICKLLLSIFSFFFQLHLHVLSSTSVQIKFHSMWYENNSVRHNAKNSWKIIWI